MADDPIEPAEELRAFLAAELAAFRARWGPDSGPEGAATAFARRLDFQRLLARGGWAAPGWPVEHGGRGLGVADRLACDAVLAELDAPLPLGVLGLANVGPALIEFGDAHQRASLARILDGSEIWCQGFSEPGAGSDLASLRTSARLEGDHFVINGQKVWTSNGMEATHCMLLARTDPEAPRHRGISVLLVPLDTPGIERRPITMISGDQEFAELFFTDVRVPAGALLGPLHRGWGVTMRTLVHERTGVLSRAAALERRARYALLTLGGRAGLDAVTREELVRRYVEARVLSLLGRRTLARAEAGIDTAAEQSLIKLAWGVADRALAESLLDASGAAASGGRRPEVAHAWLWTRASTIAAGTTEVLKDLLGERVLGLPR
jgi:alkylation response protein AidB-like acyl-CoA dehydrogenase